MLMEISLEEAPPRDPHVKEPGFLGKVFWVEELNVMGLNRLRFDYISESQKENCDLW